MTPKRKYTRLFSLIFLSFLLFSCEERRCVNADEFDVETVVIESKPIKDGIFGTYDHFSGGQRANWHDSSLRSNGEQFLMQISGQWTPWRGEEVNDLKLDALPRCNLCAKKPGAPNCICRPGQTPVPEKCADGNPCSVFGYEVINVGGINVNTTVPLDCSNYEHQANPNLCTCTNDPQYGTALDFGVYHIILDVMDKDEIPLIGDRQQTCKLDRGIGAYIGLFGANGATVPKRVYQLYSEEEVCNVIRDSNGDCVDEEGNDITAYAYRSANDRIFMKDDKADNDGTDTNTSDDEYHSPNEIVKVIMYDSYYYDNYGKYNLAIYQGVGNNRDPGLLEFMVRLVEDTILGEENADGVREGGIIEFMYKAIVQDSGFVLALQIALSLYIAIYGAAVLFGVAEISKKELTTRVLKIGLIIMFTSKDSWYFYNQIVVGFFKDSLDYMVSLIMSLSDQNVDQNSMIKIAQMNRANDISNATRFSYVDLLIKKLFAEPTTMKIFGLFFGTFFGFLYIPIIYFLIGYFVYVMLLVGTIYVVNLMKIVFVLSLGPIFFTFTLFSHTAHMFKNWIAFLGGRSIEIIVLFTVLYNFLLLLDKNFTAMLAYRACVYITTIIDPILVFHTLHSHINRPLLEWLVYFITIGGLTFITQLTVLKVGDLAAKLISIGGVNSGSSSSFGLAGGMMGQALNLAVGGARSGFGTAMTGLSYGVKFGGKALRSSGVGKAWNAVGDRIKGVTGLSSPRSALRNNMIDSVISNATKEANRRGYKGKDRDQFIRAEAHKSLRERSFSKDMAKKGSIAGQGNWMRFIGVNTNAINARLDKKLIDDPLKKFIKEEAKRLKDQKGKDVPLGEDMRKQLRENAQKWATDNLHYYDKDDVKKRLDNMKGLIKDSGELTTSEAAERFAGNKDLQNKYLQHLRDSEYRRTKKAETGGISNWMSRAYHNVTRDVRHNPKMAEENFTRKVGKEKEMMEGSRPWTGWSGYFNPLNRVNVIDKAANYDALSKQTESAKREATLSYLRSGEGGSRKEALHSLVRREATRADAEELARIRRLEGEGAIGVLGRVGSWESVSRGDLRKQAQDRKAVLVANIKDGLDAKNGQTLLERAARLSQLNREFGIKSDPLADLSKAMKEKSETESKKIADDLASGAIGSDEASRRMKELREKDFSLYATDTEALEGKKLSELFSENIKELEEKLKTGDKLEDDLSQKEKRKIEEESDKSVIKSQDEVKEKLEEVQKEVASVKVAKQAEESETSVKQLETATTSVDGKLAKGEVESAKKELEEVKKTHEPLIAQKMEIEFGSSISDALIKGGDVTIKGGNVMIGGEKAMKTGDIDESLLNSLRASKNQCDGKLKITDMERKIKTFELDKLKTDPDADQKSIAKLEQEIKDLERDCSRLRNERDRLETGISTLKAAAS